MGIASSLLHRLGLAPRKQTKGGQRSERFRRQRAHDRARMRKHLDAAWYSEEHGLEKESAALSHYARHGRGLGFSPNPHLVGPDGKTLTRWGTEFLLRSGVPIGERGAERLAPDDERAMDPLAVRNTKQKRLAVVSAIFGGYDRLLPIEPSWREDADFYLLSDRIFPNNVHWTQLHANYHNDDPTRRARFCKLHLSTYFMDYEWVMWVDGNILICTNPLDVLNELDLANIDMATFVHPDRANLMSEAAACALMSKEDPHVLAGHLRRIEGRDGFRDSTLYETMVLFQRPSAPSVRAVNAAWWKLMMSGSRRDQLSLPIVLKDVPEVRVGALPGSIRDTPHFAKIRH